MKPAERDYQRDGIVDLAKGRGCLAGGWGIGVMKVWLFLWRWGAGMTYRGAV